jgi:AraC-like DNA-binding protein
LSATPQPVPAPRLIYAGRERSRSSVRSAFPRRRWRHNIARNSGDFAKAFRESLIDAAIIDACVPSEDVWTTASLARDFPSIPFFAVLPMRATEGPALARFASLEFADLIADGLDDRVIRELVVPHTFSRRFADALMTPPPALGLSTPMQMATWRAMLPYAGRPMRTSELAKSVGVTREHLSRHFSQGGAPNLKRVIDLVRLIGAAELAKNPGYDIKDVAGVLGFASPSHLSVTASRVLGSRPASLARLRTVDLIDRFTRGRTRSRGSLAPA